MSCITLAAYRRIPIIRYVCIYIYCTVFLHAFRCFFTCHSLFFTCSAYCFFTCLLFFYMPLVFLAATSLFHLFPSLFNSLPFALFHPYIVPSLFLSPLSSFPLCVIPSLLLFVRFHRISFQEPNFGYQFKANSDE